MEVDMADHDYGQGGRRREIDDRRGPDAAGRAEGGSEDLGENLYLLHGHPYFPTSNPAAEDYPRYRGSSLDVAYGGYGVAFGAAARSSGRRNFAGRGPKGYRRPDARIEEDVCEALTRHPDIDASDIEVRVQNGEVTLSGTVDERRDKRLAEDITEWVSGVADVHNELRVKRGLTGGLTVGDERAVERGRR